MSCDCCLALPGGVMGLSAVCDCGISLSYSLFLTLRFKIRNKMSCAVCLGISVYLLRAYKVTAFQKH